jgi:hypothetical protein
MVYTPVPDGVGTEHNGEEANPLVIVVQQPYPFNALQGSMQHNVQVPNVNVLPALMGNRDGGDKINL